MWKAFDWLQEVWGDLIGEALEGATNLRASPSHFTIRTHYL
jgi:hypothetical protein